MNELKAYLSRMSEIKRSGAGVKETSYYGSLETLFNETGKSLKPEVRCIINLANRGAGIPDGGFFTPGQFQKRSDELIKGQLPERGAVEIKGTSDEVEVTEVTNMTRRIAALVLLEAELNVNYQKVKSNTYSPTK